MLISQPITGAGAIGPVRGLIADGKGGMWVRVDGPRLLLYRQGKFEDAYTRFNLLEAAFTAMSQDGEGGVLLSGLSGSLSHYRNGRLETVAKAGEISGTVTSVAETRDGRVWIGTRDYGLFRADQGSVSGAAKELIGKSVNALVPASNGGLWVGTDAGYRVPGRHRAVELALPPLAHRLQVFAMIKDRQGNVGVATGQGLVRITRRASFRRSDGQWRRPRDHRSL
jgi:ligand-binding sensor domain-containing protein